jgi:hypothetical protein
MKQGDHAYLMFTKLLSPADVTSGKEKGAFIITCSMRIRLSRLMAILAVLPV